jgi:acetamidase/formamidase
MSLGCAHTIHARNHHFHWSNKNAPVMVVAPGETVELDVIDSSGGAITPATRVENLLAAFGTGGVPLTGPIAVDGACVGDALKITILDFSPSGWGWSAITTYYGILTDQFLDPHLKIWNYDPSCRKPAMLSDVARVPLKPFPGTIGLAPGRDGVHPSLPPYRTGGNLDVRDLSAGSVLYLPVEVGGGLLSVGDTHAAQGQGELAGTAIESPMKVALKVELVKEANLAGPYFVTNGPTARHLDAKGYLVTCGVSRSLIEGARSATMQMIDLLGKAYGTTPVDAYLLSSVCGDLVISEMVNRPVHVVSLYFPRVVFE